MGVYLYTRTDMHKDDSASRAGSRQITRPAVPTTVLCRAAVESEQWYLAWVSRPRTYDLGSAPETSGQIGRSVPTANVYASMWPTVSYPFFAAGLPAPSGPAPDEFCRSTHGAWPMERWPGSGDLWKRLHTLATRPVAGDPVKVEVQYWPVEGSRIQRQNVQPRFFLQARRVRSSKPVSG